MKRRIVPLDMVWRYQMGNQKL